MHTGRLSTPTTNPWASLDAMNDFIPDVNLRSDLAYLRRHYPGMSRHWFDDIEPLGVVTVFSASSQSNQLKYLQRVCTEQFSRPRRRSPAACCPSVSLGTSWMSCLRPRTPRQRKLLEANPASRP